jgi:hypothetical protein
VSLAEGSAPLLERNRIISREEARQKGLKRFFTGKLCKHGHVCERRVDSSECAECGRTRGRAYHRRPDVKERVQAHRQQPDVKERIQERVMLGAVDESLRVLELPVRHPGPSGGRSSLSLPEKWTAYLCPNAPQGRLRLPVFAGLWLPRA